MQKITITLSLNRVLFGLVFIALTFFISSFIIPSEIDNDDIREAITLDDAKRYYDNHEQNRSSSGIDFVTISEDQLSALKKVASNTSGEIGYRMFSGKDDNGNEITVVAAINSSNAEMTRRIEMANATLWDACPPSCDLEVPSTIAD